MIHPVRDSLIALILTLSGLAAFAWGLSRLQALGENDVPGGIALAVGGLVGFLSLLMLLNFRWAFRITRRMQRGEGVFARWTVPAEIVTAYLAEEAKRPGVDRSRWRPRPGHPAEILFSDDAVLAGGRYHGLSSQGLQTFAAVRLRPDITPPVVEFLIREITTTAANNYAAGKFELRLPFPAGEQATAARVVAHFHAARTDAQAGGRFWRVRRRIGIGITLASTLALIAGYALAEATGWRGDDLTAMVLMIVGLIFGLAGLILTLLSSAALRRQGIRPAM